MALVFQGPADKSKEYGMHIGRDGVRLPSGILQLHIPSAHVPSYRGIPGRSHDCSKTTGIRLFAATLLFVLRATHYSCD